MKLFRTRTLVVLATVIFGAIVSPNTAQASTFDETELEQSQVIAIARPYGDNKYDLLVIEQIPGKQSCWAESGSNPVVIDPLLLNFDFTGICRRATDSNGYSLRIDGQDYGLDYILRLVQQNGELVLVATHRVDASQPEIVVGKTGGIGSGFMKIILEPGWKFSKRTYQGKVLGHFYFSGNGAQIGISGTANMGDTSSNPSSMPPNDPSSSPL